MSVYARLLQEENLSYAWIKAKRLFKSADGFIDSAEVAAFEIDLEQRLLAIRRQFERGSYALKPLRPLPRPKKLAEDEAVDRQYYHVAVEDQVAWIAVANALGPELDRTMEPWSYGNRLYRAAWYAHEGEKGSSLEIGPYRHASGHLYRKFQHSWPLFRRHITLTARTMVLGRKLKPEEMDDPDRLAAVTAERENLPYLSNGFWINNSKPPRKTDLYHASIDLKQFFPKLSIKAVIRGLGIDGAMDDPHVAKLIESMLMFRTDMQGIPDSVLKNVDPPFQNELDGVPTGLFVAGFLANVAMLPVDRRVGQEIKKRRDIAHFRFVDDHTFLAYDFDALCDWIIWYESLLKEENVGPEINSEKSDPQSLGEWINSLRKVDGGLATSDDVRNQAMRETRLDGKNPTKLMTKTLAQVSAIAATDIHILDDEDLSERLRLLEWLLLADIPEREIRPDTRAAFAANQIASLVPVLIQEADGLVEVNRALAELESNPPRNGSYRNELRETRKRLSELVKTHEKAEKALLARCFALLMQSLREHPGKARLFFRIHQYCQVTGHSGLKDIGEWLEDTRNRQPVWADYYAALSLQIMARGIRMAVRRLIALDSMQSDIVAAASYLTAVSKLRVHVFLIEAARETWFHEIARREFGVALIQCAQMLLSEPSFEKLGRKFTTLSQEFVHLSLGDSADRWIDATGWTPGVWAHLAEGGFETETSRPSAAWFALLPHFNFEERLDFQAARRYPEHLPDAGWRHLLKSAAPPPKDDSAWIREVIGEKVERREAAFRSRREALVRAARSSSPPPQGWMTLEEWTAQVRTLSPFDPRRSEWTALEIVAQLLDKATTAGEDFRILDRLHPNNVIVPRKWIDGSAPHPNGTQLSWEDWRKLIEVVKGRARLRDAASSLLDYRHSVGNAGVPLRVEERRLMSVGRLLLGLLRNDHTPPRIWNLRGNELIFRLPRARWFQRLAISSPTTLVLEACLGSRPAETRAIFRLPKLFGWRDGEEPNDATFDPPVIYSLTDLLESIRNAQKVLADNQIAVARNQPRQLIPFRLSDFAAGGEEGDPVVSDGAGDDE